MSSAAADGNSASSEGEKQVKFSLPKTNMSKVFSRSCSTAGVLSLSKQSSTTTKQTAMTDANAETTKMSEKKVLNDIPEDGAKESAPGEEEGVEEVIARAKAKRASMVKKALRYFEDKSNRSMSEDNLFTRRKNLAVHLGLDDKVSLREIQKINTYSLPVPSSATPFCNTTNTTTRSGYCGDIVVVEEEDEGDSEEDVKTKDLVRFLGMKDGITASMASQGRLSEDMSIPPLPSQPPSFNPPTTRSSSIGASPMVVRTIIPPDLETGGARRKNS